MTRKYLVIIALVLAVIIEAVFFIFYVFPGVDTSFGWVPEYQWNKMLDKCRRSTPLKFDCSVGIDVTNGNCVNAC